jgi:hypothetical protein
MRRVAVRVRRQSASPGARPLRLLQNNKVGARRIFSKANSSLGLIFDEAIFSNYNWSGLSFPILAPCCVRYRTVGGRRSRYVVFDSEQTKGE